MSPRRLIILGSTGSIGTQALEVVDHLNKLHAANQFPFRYEVVALAAGKNAELLATQARRHNVSHTSLAGDSSTPTAEDLVRSTDCDLVIAAMVGSSGLPATLAAVQEGYHVALANKEALVAAGELIVPLAKDPVYRVRLLPIDSEHAALWQCLLSGVGPKTWEDDPQDPHEHQWCPPWIEAPGLRRAILTASGGPFRTWTKQQIADATPEQALKHPTWSMGRKVTIDSASLMNKALEVIEAHWLFGLPPEKIDALIHPQSLVHAMAEFDDGTLISQLAAPDMRSPIQHALTWPHRASGLAPRLKPETLNLDFAPVDHDRFPLFILGHRAIAQGGTAGAILSAANEAAVATFLEGNIPFGRMQEAILETVETLKPTPLRTLEDCLTAEAAARSHVLEILRRN
jgi:1-deoxy-D-xylulose-5-phosphate reductoisomerase